MFGLSLLSIPIWIFAFSNLVAGLQLTYCANVNLASGSASYNQFMSNGLCHDTCANQGYVVAILQGYNCWCSNSIPQNTVSMSNCAIGCPGTALENCAQAGYFGYYVFGTPSSTVSSNQQVSNSGSNDQTTKNPSPTTKAPAATSVTLITSVVASTKTIERTQFIDQSSFTVITDLYSIGPTTMISVSTESGQEFKVTETLYITRLLNSSVQSPTTTSSINSQSSSSSSSPIPVNRSSSFFDNKAKVAGTFTAVGIVVLAIIATILYCCFFSGAAARRRRGDETDQYTDEEASINSITHEKAMAAAAAAAAGIGGSTIAPSSSNGSVDSPSVVPPTNPQGSNTPIRRNSSGKSIFNLFSSENNNTNGTSGIDRSLSKKKLITPIIPPEEGLMFPINEFDTRLNPNTMFLNNNFSKKSLNDEEDYSRKLRVANP